MKNLYLLIFILCVSFFWECEKKETSVHCLSENLCTEPMKDRGIGKENVPFGKMESQTKEVIQEGTPEVQCKPWVKYGKASTGKETHHLVVRGGKWSSYPSVLLPIIVSPSGLVTKKKVFRPKEYRFVFSFLDGNDFYGIRKFSRVYKTPYVLEYYKFPEMILKKRIAIQTNLTYDYPTAIYATNKLCYISYRSRDRNLGPRVDVIDFRKERAALWTIHRGLNKKIDDLVRTGNVFIAIDDILVPKYLFVFELDKNGMASYRFTEEVPATDKLQFHEAFAKEDLIVIRTSSVLFLDHSQGVTLLRILDCGLKNLGSLLESFSAEPPHKGGRFDLLAGTKPSFFKGIGMIGDKIAVGAGERGVLLLPLHFNAKSKGTLFRVGGYCADIKVIGDRLYAIVTSTKMGKQGSLVILHWNKSKRALELESIHRLEISYPYAFSE